MSFNPNHHHRRSIRLHDYDYTQSGAYFVTLCTHAKQCLFGDIANGNIRLNSLGEIVAECWTAIPQHFPHVELDEWVIMPNHLHGIIVITTTPPVGAQHAAPLHDVPPPLTGQMKPGSLSVIVRSFKSAVTKRLNATVFTPGERFWQRNYYEHVIRDEPDLNRIRQYILNNPAKWADDNENPHRLIPR